MKIRREVMEKWEKSHTKTVPEKDFGDKSLVPKHNLDNVLEQEIPKEVKLYHVGCLMKAVVEAPEKVTTSKRYTKTYF